MKSPFPIRATIVVTYWFDMFNAETFDILSAINEGAWWNGKSQCKTLCCGRRSDTGAF